MKVDSFSSKPVHMSATEKLELTELLQLFAKVLYTEDTGLTEAQADAALEATDRFQHKLLGRDVPKPVPAAHPEDRTNEFEALYS